MIREWNELPEVTRDLPSITKFKYELDSDKMKIPSYYFDGKRLGQIYHARLRTNCSSQNQHLCVLVEQLRIQPIFCLDAIALII